MASLMLELFQSKTMILLFVEEFLAMLEIYLSPSVAAPVSTESVALSVASMVHCGHGS